jgi:hypothetical protein
MLIVLWRFLVVMALLFWQGGFLFYASVVVPVGQEELGSHRRQGFITRKVTNYLNLSGVVALGVLAIDLAAHDPSRWRRAARGLSWLGMAVTLAGLAALHWFMDDWLEPASRSILAPDAFQAAHRSYLWVSTIQWVFGLVYLCLALGAWRAVDRARSIHAQEPPGTTDEIGEKARG